MQTEKLAILTWRLLCLLTATDAANILAVFPVGLQSLLNYNAAIMKSLYDAGHEVTFISPFPNHELLKNFTIIDSGKPAVTHTGQNSVNYFRNMSTVAFFKYSTELDMEDCRNVLRLSEIQKILNSDQKIYDVMFTDVFLTHECFLPLAEKLDIAVIGTLPFRSWLLADYAIGNAHPPAIIPSAFGSFTHEMTFFQRLTNTWDYLILQYYYYFNIKPLVNNFYNDFYQPNLLHRKKMCLIFYNSHSSIMPRSLVPNAIEIGGIHVKKANPLPQDLNDFMDDAENGVILFTFGSVLKASTIPPPMKTAFKNAFAQIPQRVIWKFEEPMENLSKNVLLTKWAPQRDILGHKNVKAFITHCGISGVYEAVYEGVPLVLVPVFSDQKFNAAALKKLGVGIPLDAFTATTEAILYTLNAVINETRYYNNMQKLSQIFKDRPMTPAETVVYWTEYMIRYKEAPHLRTAGAEMPLFKYLLSDIILFLIVILSLISYVCFLSFKKMSKYYYTHFRTSFTTSAVKKKL